MVVQPNSCECINHYLLIVRLQIIHPMMDAFEAIHDVIIHGTKVFDVLKSFVHNDIRMHAEKVDWSKTENRVLFKADERPIRSFFCQGFKDYHVDRAHRDKFKEIEIRFNNGNFYESFLSRYYNRNPVQQQDIIDYLQFFSEKFHSKYNISMVTRCLQKKTMQLEDSEFMGFYHTEQEVMELKLIFTVD
ncbi:unnamed protein product [Rotaria magnacalcarata]